MITLTNWATVKAYFSDLGYSHPGIRTQKDGRGMVIHYPDRKLDSASGGRNEFPQLEIEPPRYQARVEKGGRRAKRYRMQITILDQAKVDDYRAQELAHERTEPILDDIISRLFKDKLLKSGEFEVFSVNNEAHDSLWGWGVSFDIIVEEAFCYSSSEWYDLVRLKPVWVEGENSLSVEVEGVAFSTSWTENSYEAKVNAVKDLAQQIDESEAVGTGAFSELFFDSSVFDTGGSGVEMDSAGDPDPADLIIIGTVAGEPIVVSPLAGHGWINLRESWL